MASPLRHRAVKRSLRLDGGGRLAGRDACAAAGPFYDATGSDRRMATSMTVTGKYIVDTALGRIGLAFNGDGLTRLRLPEPDGSAPRGWPPHHRLPARLPGWLDNVVQQLCRYAAGEAVDLSAIPLATDGDNNRGTFEARVYAAVRALPWGATATYGEIARRAGDPQGARAVGAAMARNPVPIVIPCHRVLAAGHRPGGFSGPGGLDLKARLLALEGILIDHTPRLPGF